MNPKAEFDIIVYGATGFTGRLVAEYLAAKYGVGGSVKWAMAGRSAAKLAEVRDEIGAPKDTPLIVADANDAASLKAMVGRAKAILTTVGPYQLYGSDLVAACAAAGTDYLDLSGEPNWMAEMIEAHEAAAKASGARIVFSCGFDSIPFELGVLYTQELAKTRLGHVVPRIKGRVRSMRGGLSGGTAASGAATMAAIQKNPALGALMFNPFALTPGFTGPAQPSGMDTHIDPDLGQEVGPFMMATINTKNVHRSNLLQGHAWGSDFVYDEMAVVMPGASASFTGLGAAGGPKPGEGPSKEDREAGFYDLLFIGVDADGKQVRGSVYGDKDPGYGSTSKIIAETAICLVKDAADVPGGVWVPGAAMGQKLIDRLAANAGLTFKDETV
ncbi:MAG: saccharopine dehydrogenase NADP-binding domain-containing protein [Caulobacterales bacterium]|nr:saccharopine dehydrogenase NADP-binding domain-containing protein [Caulobacterales bacterium]